MEGGADSSLLNLKQRLMKLEVSARLPTLWQQGDLLHAAALLGAGRQRDLDLMSSITQALDCAVPDEWRSNVQHG